MSSRPFSRVREALAYEAGMSPSCVDCEDLLVEDLGFDDLSLLRLFIALESLSPGFSLPDQFGLEHVRVRDVEYYFGLWEEACVGEAI